jgi:hypothetical protein
MKAGWYKYKFAKEEIVYCPYLKAKVTIRNWNYEPIWIGEIEYSHSEEFWEKHREGSGYSEKEVENRGWPWNYGSMEEARGDRFGIPQYKSENDYQWHFTHEGVSYSLTKTGCLIRKERDLWNRSTELHKDVNWPVGKPFVERIKK